MTVFAIKANIKK